MTVLEWGHPLAQGIYYCITESLYMVSALSNMWCLDADVSASQWHITQWDLGPICIITT